MKKIFSKRSTKSLALSLTIAFIATILMFTGFLNTWESKVSDAFYYPSIPLSDIIIIEIDDESIYKIGQWPFSRDYYATVIQNLNESKIIGIDILFDLPREGDIQIAQALKNQSVVLAVEYKDLTIQDGTIYAADALQPHPNLGTTGEDFKTGYINLFTDDDKVTRSYPSGIQSAQMSHEPFAAVIVKELTGTELILEKSRPLITYYTQPRGYTYIPFYDVYNQSNALPDFSNKIILIGYTASGVDDTFMTPISDKAMPGVEIHANLVQSILTRDYISYQDDISAIAIIFLFALLTGLLLSRFKIHISTSLIIIIFIAFFLLALLIIFDTFGIIMNILYPLLTTIMVYTTVVVFYYRTEEKTRKWITTIFGKYVSPIVIDILIQHPDLIKFGGERRNITILFSDIRGFTPISEKMEPEDLVNLLNEYLTEMTDVIQNDQGLVDKFMGDAIMAFWGAPLDQPHHETMACESSLKMITQLKELQKKWIKEDIPVFDIGIGLNSGDAIVGNMGSSKRFDYTAIGDNVNLAARLEGLNKIYGTNILITEYTYKKIKDHFETRKLDAVKVKGKRKPILIYELLAKKDDLTTKYIDFIKHYESGLEHYFQKQWKKAMDAFQTANKIKKDPASKLFIIRCREFSQNPPDKDWNGVWEMKTK